MFRYFSDFLCHSQVKVLPKSSLGLARKTVTEMQKGLLDHVVVLEMVFSDALQSTKKSIKFQTLEYKQLST